MNVLERQQTRLAADVGGTFTDVAAFDETTGELQLGKTLTTPARLVDGIETGVAKAGATFRAARLFLHGTTVAINTILERNGARCALLTTQGFRDIYEIGRVNRPESYNLFFKKHEPLIDRELRFEIRERMDCAGQGADRRSTRTRCAQRSRRRWRRASKAIAILFLHSYRNPGARAARQAHRRRDAIPSCSSPPRTSCRRSTASSSAPRPPPPTPMSGRACARYLGEMGEHLDDAGFDGDFLIVQSTGGLFDIEEAQSRLHPHAGVRPRRRRDRHQGAVRQHRAQQRHRLRHGRHHRQGRRDLQRRRADDRAARWSAAMPPACRCRSR